MAAHGALWQLLLSESGLTDATGSGGLVVGGEADVLVLKANVMVASGGASIGADSTAEVSTPFSAAAWVRWHMGVFTSALPPWEFDGLYDDDGALVWRDLTLVDRSHIWQSDQTAEPVVVAETTDIIQWVKDDITGRFGITDTSGITGAGTATTDYVFDEGTPWLEVYSTLLNAIGNEPLFADAEGQPRSAPVVDPQTREPEHDYDFGTTVLPEARIEAANPDLPNVIRFVARRGPSLAEEGNGIRTVVNESTGPGSRQARGGRTVLHRVEVDAQTQEELDAQALALAPFYFGGGGLGYTGEIGLNPRHDDSDVVSLERPALGISGTWLVTAWDIALGTIDQMKTMRVDMEHLTGSAFLSELPAPEGAYGTLPYGEHPYGGPPDA